MTDSNRAAGAAQGGAPAPSNYEPPAAWVKVPLPLLRDLAARPRDGGWQGAEPRVWAQLQEHHRTGRPMTNRAVAIALGLSRGTVRKYRNNLLARDAIRETGAPPSYALDAGSNYSIQFAWLDYTPRGGTTRAIRESDRTEAIRESDRTPAESGSRIDPGVGSRIDPGVGPRSLPERDVETQMESAGETLGPREPAPMPAWVSHFAFKLSQRLIRYHVGSKAWQEPAALAPWVWASHQHAVAYGVPLTPQRLWEYWRGQMTEALKRPGQVTAPGKLWGSEGKVRAWLDQHRERFAREARWAELDAAHAADPGHPAQDLEAPQLRIAGTGPEPTARELVVDEPDPRQLPLGGFLLDGLREAAE